jgi:DNA-binding NtrC family response regulator
VSGLRRRILVVEDDPGLRFTISDALEGCGYEVATADSGTAASSALAAGTFDVVVTDIKLPGKSGMEILKEAKALVPPPSVITMTGYGSIASAIEAMKLGAEDYLTKPFPVEELTLLLSRVLRVRFLEEENRELRRRIESRSRFEEFLGKSRAMREVFEHIAAVAETDATVLILGESGTGKELVARALHRRGKRREGPFVALNCSAIPESLFEAEMFGYEKGAFTGADRRRTGKIEQADGGTLFLDEVAEMPAAAQAKLLRVLEERSITRIGGEESRRVDIRVVSATNRHDLKGMIETGDFREDLFYRLNVFAVRMPPLRDRIEDVPLLVNHFLEKLGCRCPVSEEAMALLLDYRYPGNVRELWNAVERASILCRGEAIEPKHLPPEVAARESVSPGGIPSTERIVPLKEAVRRYEREYIERALEAAGGSRYRAAALLGIGRKALWERLKGY